MDSSLVSICVPTYNGEKYLRECLDSAISQTYRNIQIIIIDDNSTDSTVRIAEEYAIKDNRIKIFINEKNLGLVGNWNQSLDLAEGTWIKFLFQDDVLNESCIERMLSFSDSETKFIFSNRNVIFSENTVTYITNSNSDKASLLENQFGITKPTKLSLQQLSPIISKLVYSNFIGEPTAVMFKKDIIRKIGKFNPVLVQLCDLDYWQRIVSEFDLLYIPEILCSFRVHNNSMSHQNRQGGKIVIDKIIITHQILFSETYKKLRSHLSSRALKKINEMFKLKIFEVQGELMKHPENLELQKHYNLIKQQFPLLSEFETASFKTKSISMGVKLRRKLRSLFSDD